MQLKILKMTNKDRQYIEEVYKDLLGGTYSPDKVKLAYNIIFGKDTNVISISQRRRKIVGYMNNIYSTLENSTIVESPTDKVNPITHQVTNQVFYSEEEYQSVIHIINEKEKQEIKWNVHTLHLATGIEKDKVKEIIGFYQS